MNHKVTRQEHMERAARRVKFLVFAFNVNRPKNSPFYKNANGRFDHRLLARDFATVHAKPSTRKEWRKYNSASYRLNKVFGIPNEIIRRAIGVYRDESGRQIRPSLGEVVAHDEWLSRNVTVIHNGSKWWRRNKDGIPSCFTWHRKLTINDKETWRKLLDSGDYDDLAQFPEEFKRKEYNGIREAIYNYNNEETKTDEHEEQTTTPSPPAGAIDSTLLRENRDIEQAEEKDDVDIGENTHHPLQHAEGEDGDIGGQGTAEEARWRTSEAHRPHEEETSSSAAPSRRMRRGRDVSRVPTVLTEEQIVELARELI